MRGVRQSATAQVELSATRKERGGARVRLERQAAPWRASFSGSQSQPRITVGPATGATGDQAGDFAGISQVAQVGRQARQVGEEENFRLVGIRLSPAFLSRKIYSMRPACHLIDAFSSESACILECILETIWEQAGAVRPIACGAECVQGTPHESLAL